MKKKILWGESLIYDIFTKMETIILRFYVLILTSVFQESEQIHKVLPKDVNKQEVIQHDQVIYEVWSKCSCSSCLF